METLDLDDKVLVTEREDKLTVYIDLVGEIDEDNVLIDTEENVVLVSGVTEVVYEQNENDQTKIARAISSYSDSINIPKNIEAQKIQVIETETGVTIILPKSNK
jgi:HSP20 family molecular chaperone IbpA